MKIILMILLSACLTVNSSEYPRFKRKGFQQNASPRGGPPPSFLQYDKKWGKPPQKPPPLQFIQNRPYHGMPPPPSRGKRPSKPQIHQMSGFNNKHLNQPQIYNFPKFQQFPQSNPSTTMKNYFKNQVQQYPKIPNLHHAITSGQIIQFPKETKVVPKIVHKQQGKPSFVSSPSIPSAEYDYHIQTNSIPMSANTVKQIGEKGPIHTIPAPNLTPADKPNNIEFRKQPQYYQQQEVSYQQPQHEQTHISHQYQVTEHDEQIPIRKPEFNQYAQFENQAFQNVKSLYQQTNPGITVQETESQGINIGFDQRQVEQKQNDDMLFSSSKNYQNSQNLYTQAIQSSYEQQQPQLLSQFVRPQNKYATQYQQKDEIKISEDKSLNVEPEYHSFNYDEQAHQAQEKSGQQSGLVSATYSLGSSDDIIKGENINSRSNSMDPLTQAQIVQSYFDTSRSGNDVEPDAKPSASGVIEQEVPSKLFFSSLPNKEVADRLATLQAAGKINSSLMHFDNKSSNQQKEADEDIIYVPEDSVSEEKELDSDRRQSVDYEDYSQEEEASDEKTGFGKKEK